MRAIAAQPVGQRVEVVDVEPDVAAMMRRIDLGVVRGMKLVPPVADALNDGERLGRDPATFNDRVRVLHRLLNGTLPPEHPLCGMPFRCSSDSPEVWILGVGTGAAELAA